VPAFGLPKAGPLPYRSGMTATHLSRPPSSPLRPFVELLWASGGQAGTVAGAARELVLPTGSLHLVVRLEDRPLRVFRDAADAQGFSVSGAVIGGARAAPYLKDVSRPAASVGALLRPGAAALLVGAPAGAFAGIHTALEDVWGTAAVNRLRNQLAETASPVRRLETFEAALLDRLPWPARLDARMAHAVGRLRQDTPVARAAAESGLSHRHFTERFREAVGLAPKTWCRVQRFGRALDRLAVEPATSWAALAAAEGYADQAHFAREFRILAGLTPGAYRRRAPAARRHVPID
jgi:AraC-like DNA-binding protein